MDELLIGYALKALPPAETAEVERLLAADPCAEKKLARVRGLLEPLAADPAPEPPPGLAVAAIARLAAHLVDHKLPVEDPPPPPTEELPPAVVGSDLHPILGESAVTFEELPVVPAPPVPAAPPRRPFFLSRWVELGLVASIAFLAVGLATTGIMKARHASQVEACKNQMMVLHGGLSGYADAHQDQFPKVGTPTAPTAGAFINELVAGGQLPASVKAVCPSEAPADGDLTRVSYVYTLGYQSHGQLLGIRRRVEGVSDELTPLLADLPTPSASPSDGPVSPHGRGQNILYGDGHVRYSLFATVGPDGDDIYRNDEGRVRAGLHRLDASLGRATDVP